MTMQKTRWAVAVAAVAIGAAGAASATTLSGTLTADNAFYAYISTSPSTAGTLIGSGNYWPTSFSLTPTVLTPGVTYYLNIEAINYGAAAGFSGVFSLSDTGFHFANGAQSLTTDPSNLSSWTGSYNNSNSAVTPQPWVAATGSVLKATSYTWGNIAGAANWIWPSDSSSSPGGASGPCGYCTVDFTAVISSVPEPAAWTMMLTGFVGLGGILRSRRRRLAAWSAS
jgi:hypothetical protein